MGDAASPTDGSPPPADSGALATRPPVYPVSPPVRCGRWYSHRLRVPAAMAAGCVPSVAFGGPVESEPTLRYATVSACAQVLLVNPTMSTQIPPLDMIPPGMTLVPGGITPAYGGLNPGMPPSVQLGAQFGSGLQRVAFSAGMFMVYRANFNSYDVTDPTAQFVAYLYDVQGSNAAAILAIAEIPQPQGDGTFVIQRRFVGYASDFSSMNLPPLRRRTGAPQTEGVTTRPGMGTTLVTCAAADGKIIVDWYSSGLSRFLTPVEYDTGDPEIQRCTIANVAGTLVGIASSGRRNIAFVADLSTSTTPSAIRPISPQPYFLPPDMAQVSTDEGPFDVAIFGSTQQVQAGLVTYGRRAMGASFPMTSFGVFDRMLDYDSMPTSIDPWGPTPRGPALTAAAMLDNGQIAFARYLPSSGELEAATAVCAR